MRLLIVSFLLAIAIGTPSHAETPEETQIYVSYGELNYVGPLTEDANRKLFTLYESLSLKPTTLSIRSNGGDVNLGLALGTWVHTHHLDVKVLEFCLSSCANYVFPAGAHKTVSNFAVIGFHGGLSSVQFSMGEATKTMLANMTLEKRTQMLEGLKTFLAQRNSEEAAYFTNIGVQQKLTTLGQQERYQALIKRVPGTVGWTYSKKDFNRLGVTSIDVINPPWKPADTAILGHFAVLPLE